MLNGFSQRSPKNYQMTSGPQMCPKWKTGKVEMTSREDLKTGKRSMTSREDLNVAHGGGKWARFVSKNDETLKMCFQKTNFFIFEFLQNNR